MKTNTHRREILISAFFVILTIIFLQVVMGDSLSQMQRRWFVAIGLVIVAFLVFMTINDKEMFLLRITIFLLPYHLGFVYAVGVEQDLIFACDMGIFALYFYWMIDTHGFQTGKFYWPKAILPAALFIAWSMTSLPFAITPLSAGIGALFNFKGLLIFFYIANRINDKRKLRILVQFLILVLAIEGSIGFLQKVLGHSLGLRWLGEARGSYLMDMSRITGTFRLPNLFGAYLACFLPISIGYFIFEKTVFKKLILLVVSIVGFLSIFWSLSRSAWVGIVMGMLVMTFFMLKGISKNPRLFRTLFIVLIAMIVIIVVFYDVIMMRWQTGVTMQGRFHMMEIAMQIISKNPVTGVGLYNYEYHSYPLYRWWRPVHNEYLRLGAEVGVPGLLFFLWFLFSIMKNAMRGMRLKDRFLNAVALSVIGCYTTFSILILFGPEFRYYRLKILIWIMAGLGTAILRIRRLEIAKAQQSKTESHMPLAEPS